MDFFEVPERLGGHLELSLTVPASQVPVGQPNGLILDAELPDRRLFNGFGRLLRFDDDAVGDENVGSFCSSNKKLALR